MADLDDRRWAGNFNRSYERSSDRREELRRARRGVADLTSPLPGAGSGVFRPDGEPGVADTLGAELRTRRRTREEERVSLLDWSLKVPEPKAGRLDFGRFPFQSELYGGRAAGVREVVVKKSTQVGVSAWLLRWTMYWADMRSLNALYVFPRLKQMYDFSDARIRASILRSEYLQSRIPPSSVQNKGLKQIGGGFVYFRGSESEDDLDSVDADVLALDEYDRLVPANVPIAERRIGGSRLGLIRRVGVPTIPNFGVSRLYENTDRRRWMVTCRAGHEDHLTWGEGVCQERRVRQCSKCGVEIRPEDVAGGRWAAEAPGNPARGYHVNRLILPEARLDTLFADAESTLPEERQAFWNRDMGEAYAPAEGRLSPQAIASSMSAAERAGYRMEAGYDGDNLVTMGVDVASRRNLNVRVSEHVGGSRENRKRALWVGEATEFGELDGLMDRFGVHMAAIDHEPEYRSARAFAERFPGRVYVVRYATGGMQRIMAVQDDDLAVTVRRTEAIDAMMEGVRAMRNMIAPDAPADHSRHLQALIRVVDTDALGRKKVRYESTGRDDYAHAEVYDLVAAELWWYRQAVGEGARESYSTLDEHLDWEPSVLRSDDPLVYRPGPGGWAGEAEYAAGFGE